MGPAAALIAAGPLPRHSHAVRTAGVLAERRGACVTSPAVWWATPIYHLQVRRYESCHSVVGVPKSFTTA